MYNSSQLILYTQPTCPQCKMVHMLLDKKKIQYTEISDMSYMTSIGINHTPTIEVDGNRLTGAEMMKYINGAK